MGKESKKIKIRISIDVELPSLKDLFDEGDESAEPGDQENPSKPEPGEASKGESKTESAEASSEHLDQETGTIANERDHFENAEGVTDKHPPQEPVVKTKHSDKTVPVKREKKIKAKHVAISLAALGGVGAVAFRFLKKGQKNGVKRYLGKNVNKFLEDHGFKPKRPKRVKFDYVLSLLVGFLIAFLIINYKESFSDALFNILLPGQVKKYGSAIASGLIAGFIFFPYRDKAIEGLKKFRGEFYGLASVIGLLFVFVQPQIKGYSSIHVIVFIVSFYFAQNPIIRYYWRQFLCLVLPPVLACYIIISVIPSFYPDFSKIDNINFTWVKGGKVTSKFIDEDVWVSGFWISKKLFSKDQENDITWAQANKTCENLNKENRSGRFRLPTVAELEKAYNSKNLELENNSDVRYEYSNDGCDDNDEGYFGKISYKEKYNPKRSVESDCYIAYNTFDPDSEKFYCLNKNSKDTDMGFRIVSPSPLYVFLRFYPFRKLSLHLENELFNKNGG